MQRLVGRVVAKIVVRVRVKVIRVALVKVGFRVRIVVRVIGAALCFLGSVW